MRPFLALACAAAIVLSQIAERRIPALGASARAGHRAHGNGHAAGPERHRTATGSAGAEAFDPRLSAGQYRFPSGPVTGSIAQRRLLGLRRLQALYRVGRRLTSLACEGIREFEDLR